MSAEHPSLIEPLNYEALLAEQLVRARKIDGWTADLESDPVMKLLEITAYRELALRAKINHTAISNLLKFAKGSDLDALAAFYSVVRLADESDERLRRRLTYAIAAMAGNGTYESYMARGLAAHIDVIDLMPYRLSAGKVNVAVWGSESAISAVRAALTADTNEMLGIDVVVFAARILSVNVSAKIVVDASAPTNIEAILTEQLRTAASRYRGFGQSLARSKIAAWLDGEFVRKVNVVTPDADITPDADWLWQLDNVVLEVVRE